LIRTSVRILNFLPDDDPGTDPLLALELLALELELELELELLEEEPLHS